MRNIGFFLLVLMTFGVINGQNNDTQAALGNVVTGSLIGGLGALINKKDNQRTHEVILKGMAQGAIGGYLVFESKRLVRSFSDEKNYNYVWPSRLLNFSGNSIMMNAASNRNFWERWYVNIGFSHIEYDLKKEKRLSHRIMPVTLIGNIYAFTQGKLDFSRSLKTGNLIFNTDRVNFEANGRTFLNTIVYTKPKNEEFLEQIIAHELIHVYQYEGYMATNSFLDRFNVQIKSWDNFPKWYNSIFYSDFHSLTNFGVVGIENLFGTPYEKSFFEKEAYFFDGKINGKDVPRLRLN